MVKTSFFIFLLFLMVGCQTIVSYSESDIVVKKGQKIEASDRGFGFLELTTPDLSVNKQLADQCRNGKVTGVETSLTREDLLIVQDYELHASASCQGTYGPAKTSR